MAQIDLDWQHKSELFLARLPHEALGHQGRDATYKWAKDRGVDLTMDAIAQVIHDCETCAIIKQAKRMKPLWGKGDGKSINMGRCGRLIISPCHDLAMVRVMCLPWWKQPLGGLKHMQYPMLPPETP